MTHWNRAAFMQGASLLFALALIGRAAQVQLLERNAWRTRARAQQLAATPLPAARGTILDASGEIIVESRQLVKLSVAPREVAATVRRRGDGADRMATLAAGLARAGVSQEWVRRAGDTTRAWVDIPGRFLATDVAAITNLRGVHAEPALERVPPANDGLRRLVGRSDDSGGAVDGLEKSLDAMLRGTGGRDSLVRDVRGQRIRSPEVIPQAPTPGYTVILSLNRGLQDIAERALADAVRTMQATGGDIVMLDPATGEVRAMASLRASTLSTGATALTEPYEPGSTLKPFFAARLLDMERARANEIVNTHNGEWTTPNGRKVEDDHPMPQASLADVIRWSSNIGIIQFADRLSAAEKFELLRDLGLGTPTGLPYPSEAAGVVPAPRKWDGMTATSLPMGYAVSVTPLQLAAAYGAIANGGELLEPAIVKEIRAPDGVVKYRHERRVVRRVMSETSARALRSMLRGVVEAGTATGSSLSSFDVAGKTGTARRAINGKYVDGKYNASFVGMFPADDPQLVILVKLDDPTKSIYGGRAAAPVSRVVLQAALAAREASLNRSALARADAPLRPKASPADAAGTTVVPVMSSDRGSDSAAASAFEEAVTPRVQGATAFVAQVGPAAAEPIAIAPVLARVAVPDVRGLPMRRAVYEIHRAGFRASLGAGAGGGDRAEGTAPAAGSYALTGTVVAVSHKP